MNELEELEALARKAVADYTSTLPPEEQIRRRGLRRRHRRTAAIMGAATVLAATGVWAAPRLLPRGEGEAAFVAAAPSTTESPAVGAGSPSAGRPRVGDVDAVLGATLIEVDGCPALSGVDWTVSVGPGPLSTAPLVAVSHGGSGGVLAKGYAARRPTPGWLTQDPHPDVRFDASGNVTITEASSPDAGRSLGALVASDLGCRSERWARRSASTDADIEVLTGKPALLYVLGVRAKGSRLQEVTSAAGSGVTVWRVRRDADEALVVDRRPSDVIVIRTLAGTLPAANALLRWLSRP